MAERMVGTISRGIRAPIIRSGDNLADIVVETLLKAAGSEGFVIEDRDILAVTEAVVARAQGNYVSIDTIAQDIQRKFPSGEFGVIFPILSRNRFAICLRGIAKAAKKIYLMLSYPSDEVGNHLMDLDALDERGVNPYLDVLDETKYRELFGENPHPFTGVDYVKYYTEIIRDIGAEVEVVFANQPKTILDYTKNVLVCDIHTRTRTKRILRQAGAEAVYGLDDICTESIEGSGFNAEYGLLGSNKATEQSIKLFPRNSSDFVRTVQEKLKEKTGKMVEVLVYGDGAFKDPVGKIWELADPVVSPAFTDGLVGQPNEFKLKYLADNNFAHLQGDALKEAITEYIKNKEHSMTDSMEAQGTTPRRLADLIGSLSDLTSGSGDKGTPIVFIQGYFDNYTV